MRRYSPNLPNMKKLIKPSHQKNESNRCFYLVAAAGTALLLTQFNARCSDNDWSTRAISPVANPIYFEDPLIDTEARPIYMDHRLPDTFHFSGGKVPLGGDIQVIAAQLRYALSDRLALIATKDGYIMSEPDHTLKHTYGWGNISAGLKYAVVDDKADELIVTPGFTVEIPMGDESVFQGHGAGLWNLFTSAEKGWQDFHVTGNAGFLLPDDFSKQTAEAHYSLQADYYVCQYFIPFAVGNGYTVLSEADNKLLGAVNLNSEFNDLSDFGSTKADGRTQLILGAGFRSRLLKNLDLGFAYEFGATNPQGIFKDRFTADLIWRF
jgi:hypothetical protein